MLRDHKKNNKKKTKKERKLADADEKFKAPKKI